MKILKKKRVISYAIIAVFTVVIVIAVQSLISFIRSLNITNEYLFGKLEASSELTSAKYKYTGLTPYQDQGIPIINKADFIMTYGATVRAGINISEVDVDVNRVSKVITLTVPRAVIQEVKIDHSTIKYYDEKLALFNSDPKIDNNKAIAMAEENAKSEAKESGILEFADERDEYLLRDIISRAVDKDYTIEIKYKDQ